MTTPLSQKMQKKGRIALPNAKGFQMINIAEIIRCEAMGNYTTIYLQNGESILVCRQLGKIEPLISPYDFLRVHHSHLVNLYFIQQYFKEKDGRLLLMNGDFIPIARGRKKDLLEKMSLV